MVKAPGNGVHRYHVHLLVQCFDIPCSLWCFVTWTVHIWQKNTKTSQLQIKYLLVCQGCGQSAGQGDVWTLYPSFSPALWYSMQLPRFYDLNGAYMAKKHEKCTLDIYWSTTDIVKALKEMVDGHYIQVETKLHSSPRFFRGVATQNIDLWPKNPKVALWIAIDVLHIWPKRWGKGWVYTLPMSEPSPSMVDEVAMMLHLKQPSSTSKSKKSGLK